MTVTSFSGLEEFWKFRPGLVGDLSGAERCR